jgi:hypothetical protein
MENKINFTKSEIYEIVKECLGEIRDNNSLDSLRESVIRESFSEMIESVSPREYDHIILEFDESDTDHQINELFGIGEKVKAFFSGNKSDKSNLHPYMDKEFSAMKKNLNLAVNMFNMIKSTDNDKKRAAKFIYDLLIKRKNPVQILKNMTNLGYGSENFWNEICEMIENPSYDY